MTKKQYKQIAKEILNQAAQGEGEKPPRLRINHDSIEIAYNEKGQFYSLVFEIDYAQKFDQGEITITKLISLPINLMGEVAIKEVEEEAPKELKAKRGRPAKVEEME